MHAMSYTFRTNDLGILPGDISDIKIPTRMLDLFENQAQEDKNDHHEDINANQPALEKNKQRILSRKTVAFTRTESGFLMARQQ